MFFLEAGAGERGGHGCGDGAAGVCLGLLVGGESGGLLHGLDVQRVQPPLDLACHMSRADRAHLDRRCRHLLLVRLAGEDLQPLRAVGIGLT
ncbi:hypothetical protein ACOZCG_29295 [Streptomyces pseudogriseolus]|uniref:hypothetical protein n=1 Tax=Streptomyces pseudogriseolus TaxID=36817 RepID=UPI003FA28959